jgi:hypothetical protein
MGVPMTKLYVALQNTLAIVSEQDNSWTVDLQLTGSEPQCVAVDPLRPELVYCGTFDQGLWYSHDAGKRWRHVDDGITSPHVMSVAVSSLERVGDYGVVYAGTEPSAIYRSEDAGRSWRELTALRQLPSASSWSFPPRPYTSHIRWITPDPVREGRVFAAAEAGALVRSMDGGEHWDDRRSGGPFDTHTLIMHRLAPDRLYSAAGDGFMRPGQGFVQSDDGGDSWYRPDAGLEHHYLWSVAADPADPSTLIISAAHGPREAHDPQYAESTIYRRSGTDSWQRVHGLPEPGGLLAFALASHESEPGVFYAANNRGIFRSADGGMNWQMLPIQWPVGLTPGRAHGLAVIA